MKIVEPSVELLSHTPNSDVLIAKAGWVAHQTEGSHHLNFIKKLIEWGHESVLEHASATFSIICDRGISHEIVRHRIASYTQESTRYCRYKDEIQVIKPTVFKSGFTDWFNACKTAESSYLRLLLLNIPPEIARSVLPTCLKTQLVMTANFREWRHFLKLRLSNKAHPQIREIAGMICDELVKISVCFEEFKE